MQNQFHNQPVVSWARQNLVQPVEIRVRFASRRARLFIYALLFSIPVLIIAAFVFLKLTGGTQGSWLGIFMCGGVLFLPCFVIVLIGVLTQQKFVKSLDTEGIKASAGRKFLWENLYYVDHVSKHTRVGGISRVTKDNQLEFVFADGKAIIPPLIENREQIWNLINSMPVEVKDDGEARRKTAPPDTASMFNDFMNQVGQSEARRDQSE